MKIFGREPAVFFAMIGSVLYAVSLFFNLSPDAQGWVNAVIVALAGFATAAFVSVDAALPALVGLLKAVFALVIGLKIQMPDYTQVAILTLVTAVGAFWVRTQVAAKVLPA